MNYLERREEERKRRMANPSPEPERPKDVGGAILGFYGAIKICRREGYEPEQVFRLVLKFIQESKDER